VKPANIVVCRLGLDVDFVKVLDFGLVKFQGLRGLGTECLTVDGAFNGTPGFVPPEVALGSEAVDGRADIYALGCVAYWLLTGKPVFEGRNAVQTVIDHLRRRPEPLSRHVGQVVPEALEGIVLRCLEKDPDARPSSAAALSSELASLGIEGLWTEERARSWWRAHRPLEGSEGASRSTGTSETDRSVVMGAEARSAAA
jgi:serine/threonine-protein kinase